MAGTSPGSRDPAEADEEERVRGKAAAKNANRRAQEAQERIAELEARLRKEAEQHRRELREAREERDRARDRLTREVDDQSRAAVAEAFAAAARDVALAREECRSRIIAGFAVICRNLGAVPVWRDIQSSQDQMAEIGEAFGVPVGELVAAVTDTNRRGRRMTNRGARDLASYYREVDGNSHRLKVDHKVDQ